MMENNIITKERTKRYEEAQCLKNRIQIAVNEIRACEAKIDQLRLTDLYDHINESEYSLWSNLKLSQTGASTHHGSLGKTQEEPCFALLALLETKLPDILIQGQKMRGCYIQIQDDLVQLNISSEISLKALERFSESHPLP